jgi:hypothetical protein
LVAFPRDPGCHIGAPATLTVANADTAAGWVHDIEIDLLGRRLVIPVVFCPDWNMRNLLGMRGFMDQLTFAVDHRAHRLYLKWQEPSASL